MNRRTRSKRHTERLAEQWQAFRWQAFRWQQVSKAVKGFFSKLGARLGGLLPRWHRRVIAILLVATSVLLVLPAPESVEVVQSSVNERVPIKINNRGLSEQQFVPVGSSQGTKAPQQSQEPVKVANTRAWVEYVVKSGDTLANVFRANNLSMTELNALARIEGIDKPLSRIKHGQLIRFKRDAKGRLDILQLEKEERSVMFYRLSDGKFARSK